MVGRCGVVLIKVMRNEGNGGTVEQWQRAVRTLRSIIVDWDTARSDLASLGSIWNIAEGDTLWEVVSNLEFRHLCW